MVGYEEDLTIEKIWERRLQNPNVNEPRPLTKPYHLRSGSPFDYEGDPATPLIQVFSVHIFNHFDDGKPCEIYGSIRALEELRPRFHLYNRDPEDSETILEKGSLSLTGPDRYPIIPSLSTKLELCLYDRIRGVNVVEEKLNLDPVNDDSYDTLVKREVRGHHVYAVVYYVIFQFAAYATLPVKVTKTDNGDNNCDSADIYGSIVTGYENVGRYCSPDLNVDQLETRVFDKPCHQPLRVLFGEPIKLSRKVVAVPAYSSITIQVNLWDSNGKIAGDCLQCPAYNRGDSFSYIRTQYACVEVRVQWKHAFLYLHRDRKMLLLKEKEQSDEQEDIKKKQKVFYEEEASSSTFDFRCIPRSLPYFRNTKVEIFTVFVDGVAQKISALCGAILINDGGIKFSIYNRDDSCMEELSDTNFASIEFNYRAIPNDEWGMILYLRDPINNLEVSRGSFGWNECSLRSSACHNKRLCSVVRGDDGFAVVHYQIFSFSYEASVTVTLFRHDNADFTVNLHGNLFGRYSGHDYSTSYQKKYYRSRLLDLPRKKAVEVKAGSEIGLLKSIVAVPGDEDLIIEADLVVCGIDGGVIDSICGMAEFEFDPEEPYYETIAGEHYGIEICASFKEEADD